MKKLLLSMLISSPCLAYWPQVQVQTIRQVEVRDLRELELAREIKELRRREEVRANAYERTPQVVYVQNQPEHRQVYEPKFKWLTNSDKTAIKYIACGIILGWLIIRK